MDRPETADERTLRKIREVQAVSILNKAAAIALAIGVMYFFYGAGISATNPDVLSPVSALGIVIGWFGIPLVAASQIVLGAAMVLAVKTKHRLIIALITGIVVSSAWTALSVIPSWLGLTPGISPTGVAWWGAQAGLCTYFLFKVLRIDREFSELWVTS